jgi:hypothetical protein
VSLMGALFQFESLGNLQCNLLGALPQCESLRSSSSVQVYWELFFNVSLLGALLQCESLGSSGILVSIYRCGLFGDNGDCYQEQRML